MCRGSSMRTHSLLLQQDNGSEVAARGMIFFAMEEEAITTEFHLKAEGFLRLLSHLCMHVCVLP